MRGKGNGKKIAHLLHGITPAYAGKSHPLLPPPFHDIGSPPPMRGKGKNRQSGFPHTGITPAYAGKSSSSEIPYFAAWDHPRLCGEKKKIPKQRYFFHQPASFSFSLQYT